MHDFEAHLKPNEKILWQGQPTPKTGGKPIGGLIFLILFIIGIASLLLWSITNKIGDGRNGINGNFVIFMLVLAIFLALAIYGLIYYLFIKNRHIAHSSYCLTNLRALKYDSKKKQLYFGYLRHYDEIHVENLKNGFGDLYFTTKNNSETPREALATIKTAILNPNPENMPFIAFESIKDPRGIKNLVDKQN